MTPLYHKSQNDYTNALRKVEPGMYDRIPKAVWAALAISFAILKGDADGNELTFEQVPDAIREEWDALERAGIVPQPVAWRKKP